MGKLHTFDSYYAVTKNNRKIQIELEDKVASLFIKIRTAHGIGAEALFDTKCRLSQIKITASLCNETLLEVGVEVGETFDIINTRPGGLD